MLGENLTKLVANTHKSEFYGINPIIHIDYDYFQYFTQKGGSKT